MATFALMNGDAVHELVQASNIEELAKRYTPELVARMVDVTGLDVKQHMVREGDAFADAPKPAGGPLPLTVERLAAALVAKGVLSADELEGGKRG